MSTTSFRGLTVAGLVCALGFGSAAAQQSFEYVTDTERYPKPTLSRPAKGQVFNDPHFNTQIVRLSDKATDGYDRDWMPPLYATMEIFSSDNAKVLLGTTRFHVYDVASFAYEGPVTPTIERDGRDPEIQSDPNDPDAFFYRAWSILYRYDRGTGQSTVVHDFKDDYPNAHRIMHDGQGDPSADMRYWCFQVRDTNGNLLDVVVYDKQQDLVVGKFRSQGEFPAGIRWTSMSPSGEYALIKYYGDGVTSYTRNFATRHGNCIGSTGHSDRAIDVNGRDVLFYQNNRRDFLSICDLGTLEVTDLIKIDFSAGTPYSFHFSGNNYDKPGWGVVSTVYRDNLLNAPDRQWMVDSLFLVELKADPKVWRVSHLYNVNSENGPQGRYWTEPHANINRAGTHIVWGANHYENTGRIETMMAILPDDWYEVLSGDTPPPPPPPGDPPPAPANLRIRFR